MSDFQGKSSLITLIVLFGLIYVNIKNIRQLLLFLGAFPFTFIAFYLLIR